MESGNEVLTLQFGKFSNFIGSHWLNIQESSFSYNPNLIPDINNDILFREGQTLGGEVTYTPRLIVVDLNGNITRERKEIPSTLWSSGELDVSELNTSGDEFLNEFQKDMKPSKQNKTPILKNSYDLNDVVHNWTDYLGIDLHDKTLTLLNEYEPGITPEAFNFSPTGCDLWKKVNLQEDIIEKIRWFIEECDSLQGFQVMLDGYNGFEGLASSCLEYIRDDYSKKCILTVPTFVKEIYPSSLASKKEELFYYLSVMHGMSDYSNFSDIVLPVSLSSSLLMHSSRPKVFPHIQYDPESLYQSSAVIAAALESVSIPYRLRCNGVSMHDLCGSISLRGRVVSSLGINFPFPMHTYDNLFKVLDNWNGKWFNSLTPDVDFCDSEEITAQSISVSGIKDAVVRDSINSANKNETNSVIKCSTVKELFKLFFYCNYLGTRSLIYTSQNMFRVPPSFPKVFNDDFNIHKNDANPWGRLAELYSICGIVNTSETQNLLDSCLQPMKSRKMSSLAKDYSIEWFEFIEKSENIETLKSLYNETSWQL